MWRGQVVDWLSTRRSERCGAAPKAPNPKCQESLERQVGPDKKKKNSKNEKQWGAKPKANSTPKEKRVKREVPNKKWCLSSRSLRAGPIWSVAIPELTNDDQSHLSLTRGQLNTDCSCIQSTLLKSGSAIIIACSCTQSTLLSCESAIIIASSCRQCTLLKSGSAIIIPCSCTHTTLPKSESRL